MNEKKIDYIICIVMFIAIGCFTIIFNGCASTTVAGVVERNTRELTESQTRVADATDATARIQELIAENQRTTDELANIISESKGRIEKSMSEASGISNSLDQLIYLFVIYKREVDRILDQINRIRIENQAEE
jgi:hypothetical protein